jgi:hypothetical protein
MTVSSLPMERLGLVAHGLLQLISPEIIGIEQGGQRQQPFYTGIVVNNFISFHFISNLRLWIPFNVTLSDKLI